MGLINSFRSDRPGRSPTAPSWGPSEGAESSARREVSQCEEEAPESTAGHPRACGDLDRRGSHEITAIESSPHNNPSRHLRGLKQPNDWRPVCQPGTNGRLGRMLRRDHLHRGSRAQAREAAQSVAIKKGATGPNLERDHIGNQTDPHLASVIDCEVDRIEAPAGGISDSVGDVSSSGSGEGSCLATSERLDRLTVTCAGTKSDFDQEKPFPAPCDEIDLSTRDADVSIDDHAATEPKKGGGYVLGDRASATTFFCGRGGHERTGIAEIMPQKPGNGVGGSVSAGRPSVL